MVKPNDPKHLDEPKHTGTLKPSQANKSQFLNHEREFQINNNRKPPASKTNTASVENNSFMGSITDPRAIIIAV
jgi:hypothetical protein